MLICLYFVRVTTPSTKTLSLLGDVANIEKTPAD
jgi:hypothetical protein